MDGINYKNKLERNIQIGQLMKQNPRISSLLRATTKAIIDDYITKNNVKPNEIILRQYDGIILTRLLDYTNIGHILLERRETYQKFIASIDRHKYIALDSNFKLIVKGVSYRYKEMDKIYLQLCNILDFNKVQLFYHLQKLKDQFFSSNDIKLFGIPTINNSVIVFLKGYGEIIVSLPTLKIMDPKDIDREQYFNFYIEPFVKSIVFENLKKK